MTEQTPFEQLRMMLSRREKRRRAALSDGIMSGLLAALGPGDICFDCGANVGAITVPLAHTGATVFAFEPDPLAFEVLHGATADLPNVTALNVAVGAHEGEVLLRRDHHFDKNPTGRTVRSSIVDGGRRMDGETIPVKIIDLPQFLSKTVADTGPVTFLKVDIEGAEVDLMEALEDKGLLDDIKLTVVETHERKFAALRPRFRALRGRIAAKYPASKVNLDWR